MFGCVAWDSFPNHKPSSFLELISQAQHTPQGRLMKFQMASQNSDISGQLQGARTTQPIHSTGQQTELATGIAPAAPPCPPPSVQDGPPGTCRHLSMPLVHLRKGGLSKATASTHTVQRRTGDGPPCGGSTTTVPPRGQVPSTPRDGLTDQTRHSNH